MAWSEPQFHLIDELKEGVLNDEQTHAIIKKCQNTRRSDSPYTVKDGLLYWKGKWVLPSKSPLIQQVLSEYHSSPISGHAGIARTVARISAQFYWPKLRDDVKEFVRTCITCQKAKFEQCLPAGLLQPLPIPTQVWEDVAMDFITRLPTSSGFTVIMVVIDRLTKHSHFVAMKSDYTSKSVAEAFMMNIVKLHGVPKSIVSNRDKVFTSGFWQQLFKLQGTTLAISSAYHPQTDGQSEALKKCLEMYLRCFTFDNQKAWAKLLVWAEFWYNTSFHTSLSMTPFRLYMEENPQPYLDTMPVLKILQLCRMC